MLNTGSTTGFSKALSICKILAGPGIWDDGPNPEVQASCTVMQAPRSGTPAEAACCLRVYEQCLGLHIRVYSQLTNFPIKNLPSELRTVPCLCTRSQLHHSAGLLRSIAKTVPASSTKYWERTLFRIPGYARIVRIPDRAPLAAPNAPLIMDNHATDSYADALDPGRDIIGPSSSRGEARQGEAKRKYARSREPVEIRATCGNALVYIPARTHTTRDILPICSESLVVLRAWNTCLLVLRCPTLHDRFITIRLPMFHERASDGGSTAGISANMRRRCKGHILDLRKIARTTQTTGYRNKCRARGKRPTAQS
ncbi:hypothetical protein VTO73DRAFT_2100 [Trametes versicolor]